MKSFEVGVQVSRSGRPSVPVKASAISSWSPWPVLFFFFVLKGEGDGEAEAVVSAGTTA